MFFFHAKDSSGIDRIALKLYCISVFVIFGQSLLFITLAYPSPIPVTKSKPAQYPRYFNLLFFVSFLTESVVKQMHIKNDHIQYLHHVTHIICP